MDFPSGDQAGLRSATPGEFVILRMSPFSAGTVRISPWASKTARTPVGEIAESLMCLATFSEWGRARGGEIVEVERAELFIDDRSGAGISGFDGQAGIFDELRFRLGFCVVGEQRVGAVTVREEINRIAHPKRIQIVPVFVRKFDDAGVRQICDPDAGRGAAAVVAPI